MRGFPDPGWRVFPGLGSDPETSVATPGSVPGLIRLNESLGPCVHWGTSS
jgi:hypothetical protein